MPANPELMEVLVDMIVDYQAFIAASDTLHEQNLRLTNHELRVMSVVYQRFRHDGPCNLSLPHRHNWH